MGLLSWLRGERVQLSLREGHTIRVQPDGTYLVYKTPTVPAPMSCHTVTTPKATVRFTIKDRSVSMEVLYLDERAHHAIGPISHEASNHYSVYCSGFSMLGVSSSGADTGGYIDLLGTHSSTIPFDSNAERDTWLQRVESALREWAVEWEGFREAPKPKRYKLTGMLRLGSEPLLNAGHIFSKGDDGRYHSGLDSISFNQCSIDMNPSLFEEVKDGCKPGCENCRCYMNPCSSTCKLGTCSVCTANSVTVKTITV